MSKAHQDAMDYIYGRGPGVTESFTEGVADLDEDECQCQQCGRTINLYDEPAFVIGIYVNDIREEQQRWCKGCAVLGMQGKLEEEGTPLS